MLGIGFGDGVLGKDGISATGMSCRSLTGGPFSRLPYTLPGGRCPSSWLTVTR